MSRDKYDDFDEGPEKLKQASQETSETLRGFRQLVRDLQMSGAPLPPIFQKITGILGEAEAYQSAFEALKRFGGRLKEATGATESWSEALRKGQRRADFLADAALKKTKKKNPDTDIDSEKFKEIFTEARKVYKGSVGTKEDKQKATDLFVQGELKKWENQVRAKASKEVFDKEVGRLKDDLIKKGMSSDKALSAAKAMVRSEGKKGAVQKAAREAAGKAADQFITKGVGKATASAASKMAGKAAASIAGKAVGYAIPGLGEALMAVDVLKLQWAVIAQGIKTGIAVAKDGWARFNELQENKQKARIAQMQQENKIVVAGIQHESALRIQQGKIEDELSKKRIDSMQKYVDLMVSGTTSAIVLQEKLMAIENQRAKAQKEGDLARTRLAHARERGQLGLTFALEQEQQQDQLEKRTGKIAGIAGIFRQARMIKDGHGNDADTSIVNAVDKAGVSNAAEDRALKSIMATAAAARKNAHEALTADFNEITEGYNGLVDVVSASQVGALSENAQKKQDELEQRYQELLQTMGDNATKIKAGKLYQGSFEDAKKSGAVVYDETTQKWIYQDEKGRDVAVKDEKEFEERKQKALSTSEGQEAVALAKAVKDKQAGLDKEAALQKEKVKYEQAAVRLAQEAVKAQEEILKGLQDTIQKNIESDTDNMFGMGKRKTGAEFEEEMENRADEMTREQQAMMYKGDAEAEEEFRRNYNVEMAYRKDMRKIESAEKKESLDLEMRIQKEEHELRLRNEQELHSVQLQNAYNLFQAEQNYIKAQQDAFLKMLDERVSVAEIGDSIWDKSYGQGTRAFGEQIIKGQAEQEKIDIESSADMSKAEKQAEYDENTQKIKSDLLEENQKRIHELETQQLHEKFELERQLALKEHQLRIKLIAAEAEHKKAIEAAQRADSENSIKAMDALYSENKKAVNEFAQHVFQRDYNELSNDEKAALAQQGMAQAQGATLQGLEWLKKYAGKTEADYRDANGVLDAKRIKEDILAASKERNVDVLTGSRAEVQGPAAALIKLWGAGFNSTSQTGEAIRQKLFDTIQGGTTIPGSVAIDKVFSRTEMEQIAKNGYAHLDEPLRRKVDNFVNDLTEAHIHEVELRKNPELVQLAALGDLYQKNDVDGEGLSDEFMDMYQKNGNQTQQALTAAADNMAEVAESISKEIDEISRTSAQAAVDREKELATLKAETETLSRELDNNRKIGRELIGNEIDREKRDQISAVDRETRLKILDYNRVSAEVEKRASIAVDSFKAIAQAQTGAQYSQALLERDLKLQQHEETSGMRKRQAEELREAQERGASQREEGMMIMRHEREKTELEAKQTLESIELQRRIGTETGSTMAADALWEQIQASAFAHVEDPTVTAIESLHATLDANMAQQYDALTAITQADTEQVNKYEEALKHTKYIPEIAQSVDDISKRRVGSPQRITDPMGLRDGF